MWLQHSTTVAAMEKRQIYIVRGKAASGTLLLELAKLGKLLSSVLHHASKLATLRVPALGAVYTQQGSPASMHCRS